jgi:hypothetical protein
MDCPDCSENWKHFRLGYSKAGGYMNCWACGPKKTLPTLQALTGRPVSEVVAVLGDLAREVVPDAPKPAGKLRLPRGLGPLGTAHQDYLSSRGLDHNNLARLWSIQGLGRDAELPFRIFIPVHLRGEVVSWTTRSISDKHPLRYRAASLKDEKYNHKDLLYGEDYCRHTIVITEGPFDVWRIGPGAVCTFGTGFRRSQVARMAKYPVRVVCFDTDGPGRKKGAELCRLLAPFDGNTYHIVLDAKDAASAPENEIHALRREFLPDLMPLECPTIDERGSKRVGSRPKGGKPV